MTRGGRNFLMALAAGGALAAFAGRAAELTDLADIPLPSGQTVTWVDSLTDAPGPEGQTLRFRFLAPAIAADGGTVPVEKAQEDMQVLCDRYALPRVPPDGPQPSQIIISLSDRPVKFGVPDEAATQLFDAFAIADGRCDLQVF